jgi:hypothetical protein
MNLSGYFEAQRLEYLKLGLISKGILASLRPKCTVVMRFPACAAVVNPFSSDILGRILRKNVGTEIPEDPQRIAEQRWSK